VFHASGIPLLDGSKHRPKNLEDVCLTGLIFCLLLVFPVGLVACAAPENTVVIYTSRDQLYAEPILKTFEQTSGIKVRAVYDTGATKTAGLTNRLMAEKDHPQADVFWNSEIIRTIVLSRDGVLAPYISPLREGIPPAYRDKDGYWTGFAARARVIMYNRQLVSEADVPKSIFTLTDDRWRGKLALGTPVLGTMATHHTALFVRLGDQRARSFFESLKQNQTRIVVGNTAVRDAVARGDIPLGLIDTSDAYEAIQSGAPVAFVYPDQDGIGALVIPNTVSLVKGGPNPQNGKKLIDFLLRPELESDLAFSKSAQIPLRNNIEVPPGMTKLQEIKQMDVNFETVAARLDDVCEYLNGLFLN
jgi:iron(III) transport system substrate-binding protein